MKRREFIELAGAASAGALITGTGHAATGGGRFAAGPTGAKPLLAGDVAARLRSLAEVAEPSVDRIVIGDPGTVVAGIGTCWLPYWETCRQAVRDGVNLLVVHEPTFYTHWDLDENSQDLFAASAAGKKAYTKAVETKKDWILANRRHPVTTSSTRSAVRHPHARAPGWGRPYRSNLLASIALAEAGIEVARAIAGKMAQVRHRASPLRDRDWPQPVGVGTGCFSDPIGLDLAPTCSSPPTTSSDGPRPSTRTPASSRRRQPRRDEEAGVRGLAEFLTKTYPERKVVHYAQGCGYEWVPAGPAAE
jgi:hypothetical protein